MHTSFMSSLLQPFHFSIYNLYSGKGGGYYRINAANKFIDSKYIRQLLRMDVYI